MTQEQRNRIAETTPDYLTNRDLFSNHYLTSHLPETDVWQSVDENELQQAYEEIAELLDRRGDALAGYNESMLEQRFIRPVFDTLGIDYGVEETVKHSQRRPDYGFFKTDEAVDRAFDRADNGEDFYRDAIAVADAKKWGRSLDTQGEGKHTFENPSFQISVYLDETPVEWAVLTNGKQWRVYYATTAHRLDSYYEVDLTKLLAACDPDREGGLEPFKYFYLFFRQKAFIEEEDARFLDRVKNESNIFAEELGEDLRENIYDAIAVLAEGFLEYPENDLGEDDLDRIHDASLIYLYRLIFILYAESEGRDLLNTNNTHYRNRFSLNTLKTRVVEDIDEEDAYPVWDDDLWEWLNDSFELIDKGSEAKGIPNDDLYVPAYNGGLFRTDPGPHDPKEAHFLRSNKVGDEHLAEVISLLTRSEAGKGDGKTFVDYSSLNIRHLGSIYEGLLEYDLNVASDDLTVDNGEYEFAEDGDEIVVEEDDVYLTTDSGERKSTGSYYTPEYVVEYMVKNTLGPLTTDIRDELLGEYEQFADEFANRVFNLKILDPAMGSGHFLTEVIDYLAREIIDAQQKQAEQQEDPDIDDTHDIHWARRQVAQRCVYGVDLNPLAVELSKVSLWLRTLAADQPLAFLDHHLKTGNSLLGTDIEEIDELESDQNDEEGQSSLADYGAVRQGTIEQLMKIYQMFIEIENRERADAKEMERKYHEIERDDLRNRLIAMANVHSAESFDVKVPDDAYERMAGALEDDDEWKELTEQSWFKDARKVASERNFFHWKLAFPEVFYEADGESKENPGFDVVIGNPPWLNAWRMTDKMPELRNAIKDQFSSSDLLEGHWDLYVPFVIRSLDLCKEAGRHSFILPNPVLTEKYAINIRKNLLTEHSIESILDFGERNVFEEVERQSIVYVVRSGLSGKDQKLRRCTDVAPFNYEEVTTVDPDVWIEAYNHQIRLDEDYVDDYVPIIDLIEENSDLLGQYLYVNVGATVSSEESGKFSKDDVVTDAPVGNAKKFFQGSNVGRWEIDWDDEWLDYRPDEMSGARHAEMFETEKMVVRVRTDEGGWLAAAHDDKEMYCDHTVLVCCDYDSLKGTDATIDFEGFERKDDDLDLFYAVGLVNSTLMTWLFKNKFETGSLQGTYSDVWPQSVRSFPVPNTEEDELESLAEWKQKATTRLPTEFEDDIESADSAEELVKVLSKVAIEARDERGIINLDLLDYLTSFKEGDGTRIGDFDGYQPPSGIRDTMLTETTDEVDGLRIGSLSVDDEDGVVTVSTTVRFKPDEDEEDEYELHRGFAESELMPVAEFRGLDEAERTLVREFIQVVDDEGSGFSGFMNEARSTITPEDRVKDTEIPEPDDVGDGLDRFLDYRSQAVQLEERVATAEELIDELVYRMFGLSEEQIEVVEEAVED